MIAIALSVSAVLGACGSDNKKSGAQAPSVTSGNTSTETGTNTSTATTGAGSQGSTIRFSDGNKYKADVDRKGETILIGMSNNEGPSISLPDMRIGIEAAVNYINKNGGVNGAQIKLDECISDGSPEKAIDCANKFVEDKVDLAMYGIEYAAAAILPVLRDAGIPLAVPGVVADQQRMDPNTFGMIAPQDEVTVLPEVVLKQLGYKKIAYISENNPVNQATALRAAKWGDLLGVKVFTAGLVDPANADWTAAVQSAIGQGADAISGLPSEPGCTALIKTARQLGFKGPILTSCNKYVTELGPGAVGAITSFPYYAPGLEAGAPDRIVKNLGIYEEQMRGQGFGKYINTYADFTFPTMMDVATLLETIKDKINPDSIRKAFETDRFLPGFAAPDFNCGFTFWEYEPSACRDGLLVSQVVEENGKVVRRPVFKENGGYVVPPPGLSAKAQVLGH